MIFIAVGTQKFPLDRLLLEIDKCICANQIQEPVFAQTGYTSYAPKHYSFQPFLSKEEYEKKIAECDVLITHSGVGTIIAALQRKIPTIVFPRLAKHGEHVDDHQLEIAEAFAQNNYVLLCNENDNLADLLNQAKNHRFSEYKSQKETVLSTIETYLETI